MKDSQRKAMYAKKKITHNGNKIPYEIMEGHKTVVLNENKKDYPDSVNQKIFKKHPTVNAIQHNSHYVERVHKN
tara:strand:- start:197 stop:418 length:222 start_codon:yes stop_codon:yes gene_type:complete